MRSVGFYLFFLRKGEKLLDTYVMMNGMRFTSSFQATFFAADNHLESAEMQIYNSETNELLETQIIKSEENYEWKEYGIIDYYANPEGEWYKDEEGELFNAYAAAEEEIKKDNVQSCMIETFVADWSDLSDL